ncbi:MAG: GDSL-type esterase/lipase family protein [Candidatus Binatia bacterium]|nr:GDSL-type esterase/lipase family protein [Candidatus Binatia bacterium]
MLRIPAIVIASLVLSFAAGEGIARLAGHTTAQRTAPRFSWADRGELYTMEPNRQWVMPGDLKLVRVNSLGLRGPEISSKLDWQRILLLGDSVAFGYDVVEKKALPVRLQRSLLQRGLPVEVVNAAIPGWCARQHRLFLAENGAALEPNLVLATVVLNDIPELLSGQAELGASIRLANVLNWSAQRSALVTAAKNALAGTENPFARATYLRKLTLAPDSKLAREGMAAEPAELQDLAKTAQALSVPLGLVILPFKFQLTTLNTDAPQRELMEFAREHGIPAIDLLPSLREHDADEIFLDQVHLSEFGNEIVAAQISQWLVEHTMIGPEAPPAG